MSLIRSMRDGKDYDSEWGKRMKGAGPYAWQIGRRFEITAKRLGLNAERRTLRTDQFVAAFRYSSATPSFATAYMVRATSPGKFVLPGATVEDMYRPDLRANTDAGTIEVEAPAP